MENNKNNPNHKIHDENYKIIRNRKTYGNNALEHNKTMKTTITNAKTIQIILKTINAVTQVWKTKKTMKTNAKHINNS